MARACVSNLSLWEKNLSNTPETSSITAEKANNLVKTPNGCEGVCRGTRALRPPRRGLRAAGKAVT